MWIDQVSVEASQAWEISMVCGCDDILPVEICDLRTLWKPGVILSPPWVSLICSRRSRISLNGRS